METSQVLSTGPHNELPDTKLRIRYLDALRDALRMHKGPLLREPDDDGARVLTDIEWARAKHTHSEQVRALAAEIKTASTLP